MLFVTVIVTIVCVITAITPFGRRNKPKCAYCQHNRRYARTRGRGSVYVPRPERRHLDVVTRC